MLFVVGSGRCLEPEITEVLNSCLMPTVYELGNATEWGKARKNILVSMFNKQYPGEYLQTLLSNLRGECHVNNDFGYCIQEILKARPSARFLFLIQNPELSSRQLASGGFAWDKRFPGEHWRPTPVMFGMMNRDKWNSWNRLERCGWLWWFQNAKIREGLLRWVPPSNYSTIVLGSRLELEEARLIAEFAGADKRPVEVPVPKEHIDAEDWSSEPAPANVYAHEFVKEMPCLSRPAEA